MLVTVADHEKDALAETETLPVPVTLTVCDLLIVGETDVVGVTVGVTDIVCETDLV